MNDQPRTSRKPRNKSLDGDVTSSVDDRPWLDMDDAPLDRIIEGRLSEDDIVGTPIIWRASRHRESHRWVDGGVWHDARTRGAVRLKPIGWREWKEAYYHIPDPEEEDIGEAA